MLRFLPALLPAVAMVSLITTGLPAKAQSTGTVSMTTLGTQAAVFGGGQAGALPTGMVAVQWPTQVTLDGRLQILAPDYRILGLDAGRFVVNGGQIYADPAALLAVGYPQDLLSMADTDTSTGTGIGTVSVTSPLIRTPAPTAASLLASASDRSTAEQVFATPLSTGLQGAAPTTPAFAPVLESLPSDAISLDAPTTVVSMLTPEPRSMAFSPPGFAVPGYQSRDGAYYVVETSVRDGEGLAAATLRSADQGRGAFVAATPMPSTAIPAFAPAPAIALGPISAPTTAPMAPATPPGVVFGALATPNVNGGGLEYGTTTVTGADGMFGGIQQSVAAVPWFVWAGAAVAATGVTVVILND